MSGRWQQSKNVYYGESSEQKELFFDRFQQQSNHFYRIKNRHTHSAHLKRKPHSQMYSMKFI